MENEIIRYIITETEDDVRRREQENNRRINEKNGIRICAITGETLYWSPILNGNVKFNMNDEVEYYITYPDLIYTTILNSMIYILTAKNYGKKGFDILKKYFDARGHVLCHGAYKDMDQYLIHALRSRQRNLTFYLLNKIGFIVNRTFDNNTFYNFLDKYEDKNHYNLQNDFYATSYFLSHIYTIAYDITRYDRYNLHMASFINNHGNHPNGVELYNTVSRISNLNMKILTKVILIANCVDMFSMKKYDNFIQYYCEIIGYKVIDGSYENILSTYPSLPWPWHYDETDVIRIWTLYNSDLGEKLNELDEIYGNLIKELRRAILFKENVKILFSYKELNVDSDKYIDSEIKEELMDRIV